MDLEQYLRQFQFKGPSPELRTRVLTTAVEPRRFPKPWLWASVAAAIVVAAGISAWAVLRDRDEPGTSAVVDGGLTGKTPAPVSILNGRGRLLPVTHDTEFTLVDSARGRVRLDRGELLVEVEPGTDVLAEVHTSAGTIRSRCPFLAHCAGKEETPAGTLLAVASLGGEVEVSNRHGRTMCDAGEVVFVLSESAPERHSEHGGTGCPFASALGLVYRPEVQVELRLTKEQKTRLQQPGQEELRKICDFFRGLRSVPKSEWTKRSSEFCAAQQQKLAGVLNASQQKRLRQIAHQQEGLFAVVRPEVARELQLAPEQSQRVQAILKEFGESYRRLVRNGPKEEVAKRLGELQQQAADKLAGLLTGEQRERWTMLTGEPFSLTQRRHPDHPE